MASTLMGLFTRRKVESVTSTLTLPPPQAAQ